MNNTAKIAEAHGICKIYELGLSRVEALRSIDIAVRSAEFVGIMGPSGSGKSTLMHIFGCLEKTTQGKYLLAGKDVSALSDHELSWIRATQIGFISQSFNLIPQYTVLENVAMPFLYRKENNREAMRRSEVALEQVDSLGDRG